VLAVALGLLSSLCWGTSDFIGGVQSRRVPQVGVLLVAQLVGAGVIAVVVVLSGATRPSVHHLLEGAAGGLAGTAALFAFYRGLAVGTMSVVAPIAATGAAVPVIVGIARGEAPGPMRLLGIAVAIVGVVLVSRESADLDAPASAARARVVRTSIALALIAALGFGGFFVGVHEAAKGDPLWAILAARLAGASAVVLVAVAFAARGAAVSPGRAALPWLVALGLLDVAANTLYAVATRHGLLSVVSVAASLYPVITVMLARVVLRERVRRVQELGILAALGGVVLIAAG
jgi:drug/metabolite transporter (DMT)-like permease